jgi:hypothetical protein
VQLSKETLFQIAQYNSVFQAEKLLVSNGIDHYSIIPLPEILIRPGFMNFGQ